MANKQFYFSLIVKNTFSCVQVKLLVLTIQETILQIIYVK